MKQRRTIAYAAGPGDVVQTFKYWQQGKDDPHQVAITYSGLFFDLCKQLDAKGIVLSSNPKQGVINTDQFHVENIPVPPSGSGMGFHYRRAKQSRRFLNRARQLGAETFVISDATGHWFPFSLLKRPHEMFIPSLHCVFWSRFQPLSPTRRILNLLERSFFKNDCSGTLCVSHEIGEQVKKVAANPDIKLNYFHPVYRSNTFSALPPPDRTTGFNVFFAGRLEEEKGIFDLLQVAKNFRDQGKAGIYFDILGDGSAEEKLRSEASRGKLEATFRIHGYCNRPRLLELLSKSHVIIVPTSTRFHEGFNKVVSEGVLSGRPVITSSACPALYSVKDAVVEVPPDDMSKYEQAILSLKNNPELYQAKQTACSRLSEQFYNLNNSWGESLGEILSG